MWESFALNGSGEGLMPRLSGVVQGLSGGGLSSMGRVLCICVIVAHMCMDVYVTPHLLHK